MTPEQRAEWQYDSMFSGWGSDEDDYGEERYDPRKVPIITEYIGEDGYYHKMKVDPKKVPVVAQTILPDGNIMIWEILRGEYDFACKDCYSIRSHKFPNYRCCDKGKNINPLNIYAGLPD